MRTLRKFIYLLALVLHHCSGASERIFMDNCSKAGFTCTSNLNKRYDVTYDCKTLEDVTIYLWHMRAVVMTDNLTIQNCPTLRLSFLCNSVNWPLKSLTIANVQNLIVIPATVTHNPPSIAFRNVYNVELLPGQTFHQIRRSANRGNCLLPAVDLQSVDFENVRFETIETDAFANLTELRAFRWRNVTASRVQTSAVRVHMDRAASLTIAESALRVLEHLAFRVVATSATFANCTLGHLHGSAINGTVGRFRFARNNVTTIDSNGIQLLAYEVTVDGNRFDYLQSNALLKISPGLLYDSRMNFASIRFAYAFVGNAVRYADVGALNPDFDAYKSVASNITVRDNRMHCSCRKSGWMTNDMEYQHGFEHVHAFYHAHFLNASNRNSCQLRACNLPLAYVQTRMCASKFEDLDALCTRKEAPARGAKKVAAFVVVASDSSRLSPIDGSLLLVSCRLLTYCYGLL